MKQNRERSLIFPGQTNISQWPLALKFEVFLVNSAPWEKTKMDKNDIEELMLLHVSLPYQDKRPWLQ